MASVVHRLSLPAETRTCLQDAFDMKENVVNTLVCDQHLRQTILPMVRKELGSDTITFRKFKVNAVHTNRYYNDDWHIDRYLCDGSPCNSEYAADQQQTNHSVVIYLDSAHFEFVENGKNVTLALNAGDFIIFPSTIIHRAKLDDKDIVRRAIVLFDVCEPSPDYHRVIIKCPPVMHWPIPHYLGFKPTNYAMPRLLLRQIYGWRFIPKWCRDASDGNALISWEITKEGNKARPGPSHKIGTSIYPERDAPAKEQIISKTSLVTYFLALLDAFTFNFYYSK